MLSTLAMNLRVILPLLLAACGGAKPEATIPAPPSSTTTKETVTTAVPATTAPAPASAAPSKAERVRSVEGITEYRLANGLQVLLFPDQTQSTVTVNITYLVGSRHEGYG